MSSEPLWRAIIVFRVVALAFAAVIIGVNREGYEHPALAWAALGAMTLWTVFTCLRYAWPAGRKVWVAVSDVVITSALQYSSVFVLTDVQLHSSFPTITTVWTVGPVIVAGALGGRPGGLIVGAILSVVNIVTRGVFDADMGRDAVLLLGLGFLIGQVSVTSQKAAEQAARVLQLEAAARERERLARSIHDGVLQVLARVARQSGTDAELGRLAAEQEIALRAMVATAPVSESGEVDLSSRLNLFSSPSVQVSVPGQAVSLPAGTATELAAVVGEALANASRHAGPHARAWVLLEDLGDEVAVSVRDDGPGIEAGRLAAAEAQGRMGVAKSMRGRVQDLGGVIELHSEPGQGTEWEIRIPRQRG
ncbi:MacS family sensor histidine kinase [Catelliglobosispora koreensis]|uniref:MacS family sensor histidine kinase n=1 Tax=Catelliglobosispora koreensis TaxID=129052 RepID=UPI00035D28C8|nr:DUF5931 domain-containing protein [Catelliglobosispora koreensis]